MSTFDKLEVVLIGLINGIHALDASKLADTLSAHLEVMKSLLLEHDWIRNLGWDALVAEIAASNVVTKVRD